MKKHSLSCFAAASLALLVAASATFFLAGSSSNSAQAQSAIEAPRPVAALPVAVVSHAKPELSLPANAAKQTAQTTVKPGAVKPEAQKAMPLAGESIAQVSPPNTSLRMPAPTMPVSNNTFFSRRNPVTEAVKKTKNAIVTIRVPRPNGAKDMIGTGVIVDQHGFIVTNRHVVGSARQVNVVLADETVIVGDVIVAKSSFDLAIVRIRTKHTLQVLPLAPVDDLMVGETVIAIGHPFGYAYSVSTGIVSALGREITMPSGDVLSGLIQTNASINPGNSGGPLFNINGEWIGVNVALREGAQNIAFTINAATVKSFLRQHLSAARVSGIQHGLQCTDKTTAETGNRQQVVVSWFQGEGEGILAKGDEVLNVGDTKVTNTFDVERAFWGRKPGESVQLRIVRAGHEMSVSLTVAATDDGAGQTAASLPRAVSRPDGTPVASAAANR